MTPAAFRASQVVVLEATNPPDGTTRFIDQIVTDADPRFKFKFGSPRNIASLRYDVFHVHWPEVLIKGRNRLETYTRCVLLAIFTFLMGRRRIAILRTLHNVAPHESVGAVESRTLAYLDRHTDFVVTINPVEEPPKDCGMYIPHGHYRDRFVGLNRPASVSGRIVHAGLLRPYKGLESLIESFHKLEDSDLSLRIVGKPTDGLRAMVEAAVLSDSRVSARFGFLPDPDFVAEVSSAEIVCLPYSDLFNSGILLVALSLDRPVLVPDTPSTRAIADEVGPGWVHRFTGRLEPEALRQAIAEVRHSTRGQPDLQGRDWPKVASLYGDAFDKALHLVRRADARGTPSPERR
jgi:beta-1,4-mannosyltransferase